MDNGEMSGTSRSSISSGKTSFRAERNLEVSRTVTAVRSGSQYEIEPPTDGGSYANKATDTLPGAGAAPNRVGLMKPQSSAADGRNGVQLTLYVALGHDAALLSVDRLSQRLVTPQFGAVATFVGVTRRDRHPETGAATNRLVYEAYEQMALAELQRVCVATQRRFGVSIALAHRLGEVLLAEPSVACVCAAPHRDTAFDAVRFAVGELKARVPIWKREYYENGASRWLANAECLWSPSSSSSPSPSSSSSTSRDRGGAPRAAAAWNNLDTCSPSSLSLNVASTPTLTRTSANGDTDASATSSLNRNSNGADEARAASVGTSIDNAAGQAYL